MTLIYGTNFVFFASFLIFVFIRGLVLFYFKFFLHLAALANKFTSQREFTQPMSHHIFRYEYLRIVFTVMNQKLKTDHFRRDLARARPCLNRLRLLGPFAGYLFEKPGINVWTFGK